ncbi:MAG: hypothetical protein QOD77_932 [Thermoplasmata archaeon]|jgi:DNA-binding transcriptional ArsR family regulator|nr:hypothetical protein [Thermoplasmata archaeon]
MTAPAVLELPLDDALLKVLSSESRREIMRLLAERRMTGAELATRLELGKPAVSEHLKKLLEAGLIDRFDDPERRWVYYSLSQRGRSILEPQRVRFYLVLAVAALALMLGMALALGLVAFLEKQDAAANGADASSGNGFGNGLAGGLGLDQGDAIPDVPVQPTPPPVEAAKPEVLVYTGPVRSAKPILNGTSNATTNATAPVVQSLMLVLKDGRPLPLEFIRQGGVVVLRPQDLDLANGTAVVELVATANGTVPQGIDNATAIVPGSPTPILLPLLPGAAPTLQVMSTSVAAPEAATPESVVEDQPVETPAQAGGTTPPPATTTTTASNTSAATQAEATPAAATSSPAATAAPAAGATTIPRPTGTPTVIVPANLVSNTGGAVAPAAEANDPAPRGQAADTPAGVRQPRDAFPLPVLAILAAAVMAGVLRPLRKED